MRFERILVPIDFSDQCRMALRAADELAQSYEATITMLHVHGIAGVTVLDFTYVERPQDIAAMTDAAERQLMSWASELQTPKERVTVDVVTGDPVTEIVRATETHDLTVMSTHGRTGLTRLMIGSVAERVVRGAHHSVLVVRPKP